MVKRYIKVQIENDGAYTLDISEMNGAQIAYAIKMMEAYLLKELYEKGNIKTEIINKTYEVTKS